MIQTVFVPCQKSKEGLGSSSTKIFLISIKHLKKDLITSSSYSDKTNITRNATMDLIPCQRFCYATRYNFTSISSSVKDPPQCNQDCKCFFGTFPLPCLNDNFTFFPPLVTSIRTFSYKWNDRKKMFRQLCYVIPFIIGTSDMDVIRGAHSLSVMDLDIFVVAKFHWFAV